MRRRLIPVLAASILFAGTGFSAAAGKDDLSGLPCDRSVTTHPAGQPKIPRDYPVEQRIGQYRLFIPWAYLLGRPDPWWLNCPQRFDWTSIAFWIPDLQAPERDLSGKPFRPPVESNRPAPGPDGWVLRIDRLRPIRDEDTSIPEMVGNSRNHLWKGAQEVPEGTLTRAGENYWFHIGKDEDALIQCLPKSNCRMYLDLKDYRLRVEALYARAGVGQFDLVLTGLRKLLVDWQVGK